jgi:hypothetical protein
MSVRASRPFANDGRMLRIGVVACIAVTLAGVLWFAAHRPPVHGDTANLVRGSSTIIDCIRDGRFSGCDNTFTNQTGAVRYVGEFPLLQYLVATPLRGVGVTTETTLRVLTLLSFVSLVAILVLAYHTLRRLAPPLWPPLGVAAILAGPLLYYAQSPLGEELAAAVILGAVAAVLLDARPVVMCTLLVLACFTKETNPPFLLVLAALCAIARPCAIAADRRRTLVQITLSIGAGIVLNALFNVFRYGTWKNADYTRSDLVNTKLPVMWRIFVAQWFSPNGGIMWFWLLAPLLLIALAAMATGRPRNLQRLSVPIVGAILLAQMVVLSMWWQPFGWYAWGPRLVLPFIPALLVSACVLAAPYATRGMAALLRGRAFVPVVLVAVASGITQAVALFSGPSVSRFFGSDPGFCKVAPAVRGSSRYYHCLLMTAWSKRPWMLRLGLHGATKPGGVVVGVAFAAAVTLLLYIARRAAVREYADGSPQRDAASEFEPAT